MKYFWMSLIAVKCFKVTEIHLMLDGFNFAAGMETFCLNSVVHGHHIYKDIWISVYG